MSEIPHEKRSELMRGGAKHQAFYDTEWQSNAFAGALLIPTESLRSAPRETLVPWIIANEFGCSQRCASIRLGVFQKYSC
jgi:Zn-dependent peptidase ImmA (M78 family)